jgi:hypothetical protein
MCNLFLGTSFDQEPAKIGGTMDDLNLVADPDVREKEFFETILRHSARFLFIQQTSEKLDKDYTPVIPASTPSTNSLENPRKMPVHSKIKL